MPRFLSNAAVMFMALGASVVLFGLAPFLSVRDDLKPTAAASLESIYLTRYKPPPQREEEVFRKPPPKEKEPPPPQRMNLPPKSVIAKPKVDLEVPRLTFALNTQLKSGISVSAPPPILPSEFESGQVDQPPQVISRVPPVYPYSAKRRGVTGEVVVRFLVDIQGRVQRLKVMESTPAGIFDKCVHQAVTKWRFKPGVFQGRAVPTWVVVPIKFKLTG